MSEAREAPVIVVGAGIVGICCALYLQRDGRRVTLMDPREPGEACSFGNAGLLATGGVAPEAMPGILRSVPGMLMNPLGPLAIRWSYLPRIAPWLVRYALSSRPRRVEEISLALAALAGQVLPAYEPLLRSAGTSDIVRRSGWLHLYESEAAFQASLPAHALRRRRGIRVEELRPEEIRQLEPDLAPIFARGAFFPDYAHTVNPKRLVDVLAADFARNGGTILRDSVRGFRIDAQGPRAVVGDAGERPASQIVIAAGAWSRPLAAELGSRLPLDTERGYHVMLPNPGIAVRHPLASTEGGFAITPMEHGLRIAGTVELGGLRAPPNPKRAAAMLTRTQRMLPGLRTEGRSDWMGFRPSLPDSLPAVGRSPRFRNVYFAFGHAHRGLSFAAITGRLIADLMAGRTPVIDPTPYRADRF